MPTTKQQVKCGKCSEAFGSIQAMTLHRVTAHPLPLGNMDAVFGRFERARD